MVDNIQFNKISPLLPSTERIKAVDRRPRNGQQPPFRGSPQGQQKKKKKKHPKHGVRPSEITLATEASPSQGLAATHLPDEETNPPTPRGKRIIDIRV